MNNLKALAHSEIKNHLHVSPDAAITPDMAAAVQALILAGWRPPQYASWSEEREERMLIIGQNGNTGCHYE